VRTSAGIIVASVGKGLVALDEADGSQLWMLPVVQKTGKWQGSADTAAVRGQDIVEVPGMGVLLLNHAKLDGDKDGRLIALSLTTGKRLWDQDEIDELMTAAPVYETGDAVLVSRRRQGKLFLAEKVAVLATGLPFSAYFPVPYPFRFELARIDLATGRTKWDTEYERTFTSGTTKVQRLGGQFFIYFGNRVMTAIHLEDGKFLWEDGKKHFGNEHVALPVALVDGKLIYSSEYVRAVEPETQKEAWTLEELGTVTGIVNKDGFVVALGGDHIAAADATTGKEVWRNKTHGHTSNLLWDRTSDALIYVDGKGLHRIEAATGKSLMDIPLHVESWPAYVQLASLDVVVTIAVKEVCAYNVKTGKKLFTEGRLKAFFTADSALNNWPMPEDGEELDGISRMPTGNGEWEGLKKASLLAPEAVRSLEARSPSRAEFLEAFETEMESDKLNGTTVARKLWWIDPETNQKVEVFPSGEHHDVDRRARMVFGVNDIQLWGARID
jgi:outer membrane protein assembly factor BamB